MLTLLAGLAGTAFIGAFGFTFTKALQLSTRVTSLEVKQQDLPMLINVQFADVSRRLDRIERAMNGAMRHAD